MREKKKLLAVLLLGTAVSVSALALSACTDGDKDGGKDDASSGTEITDPNVPLAPGGCEHGEASHVSAVKAVCEKGGNKEYWFCGDCGKYFEDAACTVETSLAAVTLNAVGHSYGDWIAEEPANCTEDGVKAHKDCTVCEKHFDADDNEITDLVIAAGHAYGNLIAEVPANGCTEGKKAHYHCGVCNTDFDENKVEFNGLPFPIGNGSVTIPAPHNIKDYPAEEASCTVYGHGAYRQCEDCGEYFDKFGNIAREEDRPVFVLGGHDYGEFEYDYAAKKYVKTCNTENSHPVIEQAAGTENYPYLAKDEATLISAISMGGYVKVVADITTAGSLLCDSANATVVDLNGHTVIGSYQIVFWAGYDNKVDLTIKNGNIVGTHNVSMSVYTAVNSTVTLENVNITAVYGVYATCGTFNLNGGEINASKSAIQGYSAKYYAAPASKPVNREDYDLVVNVSGTNIKSSDLGLNLRSAYAVIDNVTFETMKTCVITYRDCNVTLNNCVMKSQTGSGVQGNGTRLITDTSNKNYYNSGVNTVIVLNECTIEADVGIYHPQIDGKLTVNGGSVTAAKTAVEIRAGEVEINNATLTSMSETFSTEANGSGSTSEGVAVTVSQHTTNDNIVVSIKGSKLNGIYAIYEKDLMDEIQPKDITIILGEGNTLNGCVYSENCENLKVVVGKNQTLVSTSEDLIAAITAGGEIKLAADIDLTATEGDDTAVYYSMRNDTLIDLNGYTITTKKGFSSGVNDQANFEPDLNPIVTVVNGTIERISNTSIAALSAADCGELVIVNCTVISTGDTAVSIFDQGKVTAIGSTFKGVYYGFGSNAGDGNYSGAIYAKLVNCTLDAQYAGLLWNIPATLVVENCEISGIGQALIARGGNITVSNTSLIKRAGVEGVDSDRAINGDTNIYPQYESKAWSSGSFVPGYALVVGNRSTSYQYATDVTLNNVKVIVEEQADAGKYVYAYGNTNKTAGETAYGATITYDKDCVLGGDIVIGDNDAEGGSSVTVNALV